MADQENQEMLKNLHQALQPMILKLREPKTRASALSSLANHLRQLVTNEEAEMFNTTCIFLFYSDQTMGILEEDVTRYITLLEETLNLCPRSYRRLMNILYIFKCMAIAVTYPDLVLNGYCNHLLRMIAFLDKKVPEAMREDIRESALLVIELLCRAKDTKINWWMLKNDVIECIDIGMRRGSELAKLTGTRILEMLLEEDLAIAYVGSPHNKSLLYSLVSTWDQMTFLAYAARAPPEFLLHIFRCYDLLRTIPNGLAALKNRSLSLNLMQAAAHTMLQDHPEISEKIGQVLRSLSVED